MEKRYDILWAGQNLQGQQGIVVSKGPPGVLLIGQEIEAVKDVEAGTGIQISGDDTKVISATGVLGVTSGNGIYIDGTAQNPVIKNSGMWAWGNSADLDGYFITQGANPTVLSTMYAVTGIAGGVGLGVSSTGVAGRGSVTLSNTGVTSLIAGTGISLSGGTGAVTVTNSAPVTTPTVVSFSLTTSSGALSNTAQEIFVSSFSSTHWLIEGYFRAQCNVTGTIFLGIANGTYTGTNGKRLHGTIGCFHNNTPVVCAWEPTIFSNTARFVISIPATTSINYFGFRALIEK